MVRILDLLTDSYRKKIASLEALKVQLGSLQDQDSIVGLFIRQLDTEISQYEVRLERATPKFGDIPCVRCGQKQEKESMKRLTEKDYFCAVCEATILDDMVSSVFEERHSIPDGTIKNDAKSPDDPLKAFKGANLVRKSGRFWIIHDLVWTLHYKNKYEDKRMKSSNSVKTG
jgi:hypothetical protein